jgi:hypothetical protein
MASSPRGGKQGSWQRVSKSAPCPVCKSDHRCCISADGRVAKCTRVAEGSYGSGSDAGINLADLNTALKQLRKEIQRRQAAADQAGPYGISNGCIVRRIRAQDGGVSEYPLANFSARIVARTIHDDGAERRTALSIEGSLPGENPIPLPRLEVPAGQLADFDWVLEGWGTGAVVYAGQGIRDHLRAALQLLSPDVPTHMVYEHTGWREVGDAWCYLHAGGALGPDGPVAGVEVALPGALARYELPAPPRGAVLTAAVRASLGLLDVAPWQLATAKAAAGPAAVHGGRRAARPERARPPADDRGRARRRVALQPDALPGLCRCRPVCRRPDRLPSLAGPALRRDP